MRIAVLFLLASTITANAQCAAILRAEDRQRCQAEANPTFATCANLRNPDERWMCRAVAAKDPGACASIRDDAQRKTCYAKVR